MLWYCDNFILIFAVYFWAISSVGLEHYLDRVGVTGSNPVLPTKAESISFLDSVPLFLFSQSPVVLLVSSNNKCVSGVRTRLFSLL